jgi:hypothetical protein
MLQIPSDCRQNHGYLSLSMELTTMVARSTPIHYTHSRQMSNNLLVPDQQGLEDDVGHAFHDGEEVSSRGQLVVPHP